MRRHGDRGDGDPDDGADRREAGDRRPRTVSPRGSDGARDAHVGIVPRRVAHAPRGDVAAARCADAPRYHGGGPTRRGSGRVRLPTRTEELHGEFPQDRPLIRRRSSRWWSAHVLILGVIAMVSSWASTRCGSARGSWPASSRRRPITDRGEQIRELYDLVFGIAVVIFFVVEGLIIWTVIRYRRRPGDDELPPQTHGNAIAEVVWTVVPTIIVAVMFVASWLTLNTVEATSAATAA